MSPLRISLRLQLPCAGPMCNKVLVGEGCPAAKEIDKITEGGLPHGGLTHPDTTDAEEGISKKLQ